MNAHVHAALLAAALLAVPVAAGGQAGADAQAARRARAVAASSLGEPFRSAGQEYRLVHDLRAVEVRGPASRSAAVGAGAEVIEHRGPFVVLRETGSAAPSARAVAVNVRTGQLGVVTGTITARVASAAEAATAARGAGVSLDLSSPATGWAFFQAAEGADVLAAVAVLAGRPGLSRVEAEVKEAWDQPE